jgi:hypothetical protein
MICRRRSWLPGLRTLHVRGAGEHELPRVEQLVVAPRSQFTTVYEDELVHESPSAMLALGWPRFEMSDPVSIARIDRLGTVFDIAALPVDEPIRVGRSRTLPVRLPSGTVARLHCELQWRDGHYEILDLQSTRGVILNGIRVARAVLEDGDTLALGDVIIRYFVGLGAHERAEAAALPVRSR